MAEAIGCPRCRGPLLVSDDLAAAETLQCPTCESVFESSEASPADLPVALAPTPKPTRAPEPTQPAPTPGPAPRPRSDDFSLADVAAPRPAPKAAERKPATPGALSDWLDSGDGTTIEFEAPPLAPAAQESATKGPKTEPAPADRPDQAVSEEPARQPSLESLLSSFRGDASADPPAPDAAARAEPESGRGDPTAERPSSKATLASFSTLPDVKPVVDPPRSDGSEEPEVASAAEHEFEVEELTSRATDEPKPNSSHVPIPGGKPRGPGAARPATRWVQPAAVVTSSLLGLGLGYIGLLWLTGPSSDVLGVSRWLPSGIFPASFAASENQPRTIAPPPEPSVQSRVAEEDVSQASFEKMIAAQPRKPASFAEDESPHEPSPLAGLSLRAGGASEPVQPLDAPGPFPASDLQALLIDAEASRQVMSDKGLAKNPEAGRDLGAAFGQLCKLAYVLTFADASPTADDLTLLEAKEVYQRLFQYGHAREDARKMAVRWINWSERAHGGVFLTGEPIEAHKSGSVWEYRLDIGDDAPLTVLTDRPLRAERFLKATGMAVVGCVIDSPVEKIPGYAGSAERAVWAGHTISLGDPKFE